MARFNDCIRSAQKQGVLSEDEAEALIARYEEHRSARAAAGDADPDAAAKTALAGEFDFRAAAKRAMADGSAAARDRIANHLQTYRGLDDKPNVFEAAANMIESSGGGTSSWKYRAEAIARATQGDVEQALTTFRRTRLLGRRMNKPMGDDVGREMLGESTGSVEAGGMGQAFSGAIEKLRQDFNRAAGFEAIPKMQGGWLPQSWDAAALLRAPGKTQKAKLDYVLNDIMPHLDIARMTDPANIGAPMRGELDNGIRIALQHILTGGWSDRKPTAQAFGLGALATQRSQHRFFHFKSYDDWKTVMEKYGHGGNPVEAFFRHVRSMSTDIAAMDIFGPNPPATAAWLKQVIESEIAKAAIGEESLWGGKVGPHTASSKTARFQAIFDAARGQDVVSGRIAAGFGDVSNVLTSAYLGSTSVLAAVTDPAIDRAARGFNGLPATKALWGILQNFRGPQNRALAARLGLGLDDFLHIGNSEARWAGTLGGHEWSRWLADFTIRWSGLNAITQGRKHRFGIDFTAMAADHAGDSWAKLADRNPYFRRAMERYGLTEKDWDRLRATPLDIPGEGIAGYLSPRHVENRDLGLRYLEMILGETERAVPTGTIRSRSVVSGHLQRGTVFGEIINSGLQFKSFTLSFTTMQWQALQHELHQGIPRGAAYAASLAIPLTLGGAMAVQINNLINGKDLQPMDPTTGQGFKFWLQAMLKGGGLGLLGDFMFQDLTRFGRTPAEQLSGPTISLFSDMLSLTVGNTQKALTGQKTHTARDAVRIATRHVPGVSSLPYTRMAYQRMLVDQLQYLTDPDAHRYFREQEQKLRRETGQGFFWRPGEMLPERAPEMPSARK